MIRNNHIKKNTAKNLKELLIGMFSNLVPKNSPIVKPETKIENEILDNNSFKPSVFNGLDLLLLNISNSNTSTLINNPTNIERLDMIVLI